MSTQSVHLIFGSESMDSEINTGARIIILGASSGIAEATARIWAAQRGRIVLCGRNADRLDVLAHDLKIRGAKTVETVCLDLVTADAAVEFQRIITRLGGVDIVLLAYGLLGIQSKAEADFVEARKIIDTNFLSATGWCLAAASCLARQGKGVLIAIGSVAGDRGRRSNYVYGAAKAGLAILIEGIAHRLAGTGAQAVLVKPGRVITSMTANIANKGRLWVKPERIATVIVKATERERAVVYSPWWWRLIMLVIRIMPRKVFDKTNF
jgi:short-subunit dehydrogenase